jgi:hypothetical protein
MNLALPELILGALAVCVIVAVVKGVVLPPTARHLGLFAETYELEVTPTNRGLLSSYIMWIRAWRIGGAVVVFVGLGVWQRVGGTTFDWGVAPLAVGYALGATVGEWLRPRPPASGPRKASLRPRTITEYVRPWVLAAIGVCSVFAVVCTAIYASMGPIGPERYSNSWTPAHLTMVALIGGSLAFTVLVLWLGARIARRPQPAGQPDIDAVHHAIRSASLVSLSGLALMCSGLVAYFVAVRVSWYGDDLPWPLRRIGGYGAVVSGLGALVGFGLSFRAIPRFAPFWRRLPPVPEAAA